MTKFLLPLSVSGSVQAHMVNLTWWNSLPADKKAALEKHFKTLENDLWELAVKTNAAATDCSVGGTCAPGLYTAYKMTLVPVSDADKAKVKDISQNKILGEWARPLQASYRM